MAENLTNLDGLIPGEVVSWEDMVAANARRSKNVLAPPSSVPRSPNDIDSLPKAEIVEYLEAHGVEEPKGKVAELRSMLKRVMFVE